MRHLPTLDDVRVASPCNANWNEMVGDDRVRFCKSCEKNVYNLSAMVTEEAQQLLAARMQGELCVRFYQRADGTMMTADCPVGVKKKQRRKLALAVAGAGALAAAAATAFYHRDEARKLVATTGEVVSADNANEALGEPPVTPPVVMGSVAAPVPPPPPMMMGRMSPPPPRGGVKHKP